MTIGFTIYQIYEMRNKWKYSIIYNNKSDKKNAINIKKILLNSGFSEREIELDLGLFRGGTVNLNRIKEKISSAKHIILILSETKNNNVDEDKYYEIIKETVKYNCFIHPVIYGKYSDKCVSKIKKIKSGFLLKSIVQPEICIEEENGEEMLIKGLKKGLINKINNVMKICVLFVFILYCILVLMQIMNII